MKIGVIHVGNYETVGGMEFVSAEIASSLNEEHEVIFVSEEEVSLSEIGEQFGCDYSDIETLNYDPNLVLRLARMLPRFNLVEILRTHLESLKQAKNLDFDHIFFPTETPKLVEIDKPTTIYHNGTLLSKEHFESKSKFYRYLCIGRTTYEKFRDGESKHIFNSKYTKKNSDNNGKVIHPPIKISSNFKPVERNKFVFVGRISPEKKLIEIIKWANEENIDFTVCGEKTDENYSKKVKNAANDNVDFILEPSRGEIVEAMENARFGLVWATETFGITTVEYMKSGTIPIVKRAGANPEVVNCDDLVVDKLSEINKTISKINSNYDKYKQHIKEQSQLFGREKFRSKIKSSIPNQK